MITRVLLVFFGCGAFISSAAFAVSTYPFAVTVEKEQSGHRIVARNDGPAPVSVRVSLPVKVNAKADRPLPIYAVVPPNGGVLHLARITTVLRGASYSFKTSDTWMLGDFNARPDGALYRLPFPDGYAFRFSQVPGGPATTHIDAVNRFAVDIPMPEGTPVVAARDGVIIETRADQTRGGKDPRLKSAANEVRVLHADGTIGVYSHLAPGGVRGYPGQRVEAGTVIGLSGTTGYSSGPHLHMAVVRLVRTSDGFRTESVPFQFYVGTPGVAFVPAHGQVVKAEYTKRVNLAGNTAHEPVRGSAVSHPKSPREAVSAANTTTPLLSIEIPEQIVRMFKIIAAWQWLAGIAIIVIAAMIASSVRHRRRREAWERLRRSEPCIEKRH